VYSPHWKVDALRAERITPGEYVLVHAVDQRPIEVEEESAAWPSIAVLVRYPWGGASARVPPARVAGFLPSSHVLPITSTLVDVVRA
jgi:hypothetical protein